MSPASCDLQSEGSVSGETMEGCRLKSELPACFEKTSVPLIWSKWGGESENAATSLALWTLSFPKLLAESGSPSPQTGSCSSLTFDPDLSHWMKSWKQGYVFEFKDCSRCDQWRGTSVRCEDKRKGRGCDFVICTVVETLITGGLSLLLYYYYHTLKKQKKQSNKYTRNT